MWKRERELEGSNRVFYDITPKPPRAIKGKSSLSRDGDTGLHIERTSKLSELVAKWLSKSLEYRETINQDFIDNMYKASPHSRYR